MSQNLYYEPVKPRRAKTLCTGLKWAIQRRYDSPAVFSEAEIEWLKGVKAAHQKDSEEDKDCQTLIDAIMLYGEVRLWIE